MKWPILILLVNLLLLNVGFAQDQYLSVIEDEERATIKQYLQSRYWKKNQERYNVAIPSEYQSSGSIILFQETLREYFRNSKNFLRSVHVEHSIVKIHTKRGLEDHQIFTFDHVSTDQSVNYNALKIIKPNGKQIIINVDSIADLKSNEKVQHKQFIIPNLEVGDIIDYYNYLEFRVLFPQQYSRAFDPVYVLPQTDHPILEYSLVFTLGPSAFINVSENKIDDFKKTSFKIDKRTFTRYHLNLQNLDPFPRDIAYFYPFQSLPNLKFQVFVGPYIGETDMIFNLGGSLKMNSKSQLSRLQDYMVSILQTNGDKLFYKKFKKFVKEERIDIRRCTEIDLVNHLYQYYRKTSTANYINTNDYRAINDYQFVREFNYLLNKLKVDHDVVIGFNRQLASIDNFVLANELSVFIKIKSDPAVYVSAPNNFSVVNDIPFHFQGTQAYLFDPDSRRLTREVIPAVSAKKNVKRVEIGVELAENKALKIVRKFEVQGQKKSHFQNKMLLDISSDSENEDFLEWVRNAGIYKVKQFESWQEAYQDIIEINRFKFKELMLAELRKQSMDIVDESYMVAVDRVGDCNEQDLLKFEDSFLASSIVKNANLNLLVSLGKFIPLLNEIREDRAFDFYFEYPFTDFYNITFNIPEGYQLSNTNPFNIEIKNRVGSLESSTNIENNVLTLKVDLSIKTYFESNKNKEFVAQIIDGLSKLHEGHMVLEKQ